MLPPPHNNILFEFDFNEKFPLLRLLQFLNDFKSAILFSLEIKPKSKTKLLFL